MKKTFSKDFYIIIFLLLAFFIMFLVLPFISRALGNAFENDSKVITQYYKALSRKDHKTAYNLLADLTFKYKTDGNKQLEFTVRPDYKKFIKDHGKIINVKIKKIKRIDEYCYPEVGLKCFKVEAAIKYKDMVVSPGGKTTIYIYTLNTGKKPLILGIRTTP